MTQRQQYVIVPAEPTDEMLAPFDPYMRKAGAAAPPPEQVLNPEVVAKLIADFTPSLNQYGVPWPPFDPEAFASAIERAVLQNLGAKNV